eukprot:2468884-Pyramimonas_sp.AAC.1
MDQSDAGSMGIFSRWTNRTRTVRHDRSRRRHLVLGLNTGARKKWCPQKNGVRKKSGGRLQFSGGELLWYAQILVELYQDPVTMGDTSPGCVQLVHCGNIPMLPVSD